MATVQVKTKNADYIIELGWHGIKINPRIRSTLYKKADASILEGLLTENKAMHAQDYENFEKNYAGHLQTSLSKWYPQVFADAKKKGKTVWSTDSNTTNESELREFLLQNLGPMGIGMALGLLINDRLRKKNKLSRRKFLRELQEIGIPLATAITMGTLTTAQLVSITAAIKKGKMPKLLLKLGITYDDIAKTASAEGRSALTAHKAETFIAPYLAKKLGKRPTIYIWMGAGHLSLARLLKETSYREKVLTGFSPLQKFFTTPKPGNCIEFYHKSGEFHNRIHRSTITIATAERNQTRKKPREPKLSRRELLAKTLRKIRRV